MRLAEDFPIFRDFLILQRLGSIPVGVRLKTSQFCEVLIFPFHISFHTFSQDAIEMVRHLPCVSIRKRNDLILIHFFHDG